MNYLVVPRERIEGQGSYLGRQDFPFKVPIRSAYFLIFFLRSLADNSFALNYEAGLGHNKPGCSLCSSLVKPLSIQKLRTLALPLHWCLVALYSFFS